MLAAKEIAEEGILDGVKVAFVKSTWPLALKLENEALEVANILDATMLEELKEEGKAY